MSTNIPAGNSPLTTYYREARNYTKNRTKNIDTITIHCYVGQVTAKSGCDYFATTDRNASSNYVVGKDGSIGLSVPEKSRSYCTSSSANDNRAVTIEVASDSKHPYAVTDSAYQALIRLVADICRRNGIKKLVWSTNKSDRINHKNGCNMTVHRDYASKACPGKYLYDRHGNIAAAVNTLLGSPSTIPIPDNAVDPGYPDNGEFPESPEPAIPITTGDSIQLAITSLTCTEMTVSVNTTGDFTGYSWEYLFSPLNSLKEVNFKKVMINSENSTIFEKNLTPATAYSLEVLATSSGHTVRSPRLIICTKQSYPDRIKNLKVNMKITKLSAKNSYCNISFDAPNSWGIKSIGNKNKGYRVILFVNGDVVATNDDLISYNGGKNINKKIFIEDLFKDHSLNYEDTIQLGIQTWIKPENSDYVFNFGGPVCSDVTLLKSDLQVINKIYLRIVDSFKRSILHINKDKQ